MSFSTLNEWLTYIGCVHQKNIELGLERVKKVAERLELLPFETKTITVGGTNGKGSVVAILEALYRAQGYQVGCYTSPILFSHNELVKINGKLIPDDEYCKAYQAIELARNTIKLTPFEFHTLAALIFFKKATLDLVILEVGLGGRLDAVNVVDPILSVITNVSLDHTEWLGSTRELIAYEKAGILRAHKPALFGEENPPETLLKMGRKLNTKLYCFNRDYHIQTETTHWSWHTKNYSLEYLPYGSLRTDNFAQALMTLYLLRNTFEYEESTIRTTLPKVSLAGRFQVEKIAEKEIIFDVAHNPGSVAALVQQLQDRTCEGRTIAVFSMLVDKDISTCIKQCKHIIDHWYLAPLNVNRGITLDALKRFFDSETISNYDLFADILTAFNTANKNLLKQDRLVVFGSFHTVAMIQRNLKQIIIN